VQDQALLLVEFDHELMSKQKGVDPNERGAAITLLVDHFHSIPVRCFHCLLHRSHPLRRAKIARVVQQLRSRSRFLFLYLDALFAKDAYLISDFADTLVELYAEHAPAKLVDFLRASSSYNLEAVSLESIVLPLINRSRPPSRHTEFAQNVTLYQRWCSYLVEWATIRKHCTS
jgi:vacuolar protein sorting-associated protein 41